MSETLRRMTIKEAMAIGNDGIEEMMKSDRKIDYLGLIAFLLGLHQDASAMVDRLLEKNRVLREVLAERDTQQRIEAMSEPILVEVPLEDQLRGLLHRDGAPKVAVVALLKYLEKSA